MGRSARFGLRLKDNARDQGGSDTPGPGEYVGNEINKHRVNLTNSKGFSFTTVAKLPATKPGISTTQMLGPDFDAKQRKHSAAPTMRKAGSCHTIASQPLTRDLNLGTPCLATRQPERSINPMHVYGTDVPRDIGTRRVKTATFGRAGTGRCDKTLIPGTAPRLAQLESNGLLISS